MIEGTVTVDGIPQINIEVDGNNWVAVIDTGFNGDLELPQSLQNELEAVYVGKVRSTLAAGQTVEEPCYRVKFPFDGDLCDAQATFVDNETILIGTRMLQFHRLTIDFPQRMLKIERSPTDN